MTNTHAIVMNKKELSAVEKFMTQIRYNIIITKRGGQSEASYLTLAEGEIPSIQLEGILAEANRLSAQYKEFDGLIKDFLYGTHHHAKRETEIISGKNKFVYRFTAEEKETIMTFLYAVQDLAGSINDLTKDRHVALSNAMNELLNLTQEKLKPFDVKFNLSLKNRTKAPIWLQMHYASDLILSEFENVQKLINGNGEDTVR